MKRIKYWFIRNFLLGKYSIIISEKDQSWAKLGDVYMTIQNWYTYVGNGRMKLITNKKTIDLLNKQIKKQGATFVN